MFQVKAVNPFEKMKNSNHDAPGVLFVKRLRIPRDRISSLKPDWVKKHFAQGLLAIITLIIALSPSAVSACTFYVGVGIFFDKNSAVINAVQMHRLKEWVSATLYRFPVPDVLTTEISVDDDEQNGEVLGRRRELAFLTALLDLGMSAPTHHIAPQLAYMPGNLHDSRRADVQFYPVFTEENRPCKPQKSIIKTPG